jgi:xylan 1,4-beta-xylosidase
MPNMETQSNQPVSVKVDAGQSAGPLAHNWTYIGYDECNYTYIPESEVLLAKFQSFQEQPYYLRAHHIFCTGNCHGFYKWGSTNAYLEDAQGNPVYDWQYIDLMFDTMLKYGTKPFVELGFMPKDLVDPEYLAKFPQMTGFASDYKMYQQYGWACPPKDYHKWYELVFQFVKHCVERWGEEEVQTWYFELWNEPDIPYWHGTFEDFNKLYDFTAAAVKAAFPQARVGGPSVTNPAFGRQSGKMLDNFLDHCRNGVNYYNGEVGTVVDFTTFHVKGGGYPMDVKAKRGAPPSVKRIMEGITTGYEIIKKYGYDNVECILSEIDPDGWAAGGVGDNVNFQFRNTEYYPSFVADSFDKASKYAKQNNWDLRFLTWAYLFPGERAFEGTRVFSTQGIDKAVLNLFRMYAKMGVQEVAFASSAAKDPMTYADMNGMAEGADVSGFAAAGPEGVQVLVYNHHDNWDMDETAQVELELVNLPAGSVRVTHYRVDEEHSNAYAEWVRQGKPMYPAGAQQEAIQARAGLELFEEPCTAAAPDGRLKLSFPMPTHSISLITIEPAA